LTAFPVLSADRRLGGNLQLATKESAVSTLTRNFAKSFDTYHGLVFRTAYRITGNAADAEDVLQTIFLRLLRRDLAAAALESEESYLRRAAVNASVDLIRARQTERRAPLTEAEMVAAKASNTDLRDGLRRALASLSPSAAEIFTLRYFEDFTNREIAKALGISQVLVAVKLHRARQQLQTQLLSYRGGQS
jgi:RNA polymerase sigma-70 factor, ECF subfamily